MTWNVLLQRLGRRLPVDTPIEVDFQGPLLDEEDLEEFLASTSQGWDISSFRG